MDNKTIRSFYAEQLRAKAKAIDLEHGTEFHNIYKIGLNSEIIFNILNCLQSENYLDLSDGLYFAMGLLQKHELKEFGDNFVNYLIKRVPELIGKEQNSQVRRYALQNCVRSQDFSVMLSQLFFTIKLL